MLYVPEGFAHGFQTLEDETEVSYQISEFYVPSAARGVRWDDPAFGIEWPLAEPILTSATARIRTSPESRVESDERWAGARRRESGGSGPRSFTTGSPTSIRFAGASPGMEFGARSRVWRRTCR